MFSPLKATHLNQFIGLVFFRYLTALLQALFLSYDLLLLFNDLCSMFTLQKYEYLKSFMPNTWNCMPVALDICSLKAIIGGQCNQYSLQNHLWAPGKQLF